MSIIGRKGYIGLTRDYRNRNTGEHGFSTGIYRSVEDGTAYFAVQIRGIGQLEIVFATTLKGWQS